MNETLIFLAGLAIAMIAYVVIQRTKKRSEEDPGAPGPSIVVLLVNPLAFDERAFRRHLSTAFGTDYSSDSDDAFATPVIENAQYLVKGDKSVFLFHNRSSPYFPDPKAVADTIAGDAPLAADVRAHKGWVSLDSVGSDESERAQYDSIGRFLSEMAPSDTVALFFPQHGTVIRFDEERRVQLRTPNAMAALGFENS